MHLIFFDRRFGEPRCDFLISDLLIEPGVFRAIISSPDTLLQRSCLVEYSLLQEGLQTWTEAALI